VARLLLLVKTATKMLRSFLEEKRKMRNFKSIFTIFGISALILSLSIMASAQRRDRYLDDDDYGRNGNGGYGNNGNYDTRYLEQTIKRVKQDSKNFEKQIDKNNYRNSNYLENLAENFKKAADDLEDEFNSRNINRSYDEAQRLVNAAEQIDRELGNYNNNRRGNGGYGNNNGNYDNYVYSQWQNMQNDVRQIANAYNIRYNTNNGSWNRGRGNRNGNGNGNRNGNGDWRDKIRNFPLPF
jgi:hypothetical protein